ncbi:MAG TPA: SDR family oxidoreductase [Spirochaetes bacterium]|nr:SDR family oxidoreductase [Spirochaetota bacterium]
MKENKVIVITGATRGIGKALAVELSSRGHIVYGTGRTRVNPKAVKFTPVVMDINDDASVKKGINSVLKNEGRIDILVNNAGISHCGPVEETPDSTARSVFETNYFGIVRTVQAVLPSMRREGRGTIVNIGSLAGRIGIPFQPHYSSSKFAVEGLSEALMHELRPLGIRVILVEPGDVGTTIWESSPKLNKKSSPYSPLLEKFYAVKQKEMGHEVDPPEKVAKEIADIVESSKNGFRFPVAKGSRFISIARKLLPDFIFLKLIARNYNL